MISTRAVHRKLDARKGTRSPSTRQKDAKGYRKNPRLLKDLLAQGPSGYELFFETVCPEEVVRIFEDSYCSSMVNFLLDLKKSTAKRILEIVVRARKKAFLNVITLYYYKDYLTNPLPLTLETERGGEIPNHYAIVGMPREATPDEMKVAQKMLVSSFSPDSFPPADRKTGEERLREIDEAFGILRNPKRRKELDVSLPNINYLYPRRDLSWFEAVNRLIS